MIGGCSCLSLVKLSVKPIASAASLSLSLLSFFAPLLILLAILGLRGRRLWRWHALWPDLFIAIATLLSHLRQPIGIRRIHPNNVAMGVVRELPDLHLLVESLE